MTRQYQFQPVWYAIVESSDLFVQPRTLEPGSDYYTQHHLLTSAADVLMISSLVELISIPSLTVTVNF